MFWNLEQQYTDLFILSTVILFHIAYSYKQMRSVCNIYVDFWIFYGTIHSARLVLAGDTVLVAVRTIDHTKVKGMLHG